MTKDIAARAVVLLSGGLDSVACLYQAARRYQFVRALGFDYGQPHRDAELPVASSVAKRLGVPFEVIALADGLHSGFLSGVPAHDNRPGTHRAFVPGRNLVFLSLALSRACRWWGDSGPTDIVIGATQDDAVGFPDCRAGFFEAASAALSAAVVKPVRVVAPFVELSKTAMVALLARDNPSAVPDLLRSWSCYAGGMNPCEVCSPCVLRARALDANGLEDRCARQPMLGGDVARWARG